MLLINSFLLLSPIILTIGSVLDPLMCKNPFSSLNHSPSSIDSDTIVTLFLDIVSLTISIILLF